MSYIEEAYSLFLSQHNIQRGVKKTVKDDVRRRNKEGDQAA